MKGNFYRQLFIATGILGLAGCASPVSKNPLGPGQICVEYGQTIYSIAQKHGISARELIQVNRLVAPYLLSEGQVLLLPDKSESLLQEANGPRLLGETSEEGSVQPGPVFSSEEKNMCRQKDLFVDKEQVAPQLLAELQENQYTEKSQPVKKATLSEEFSPPPPLETKKQDALAEQEFVRPVQGQILVDFGTKADDGKKCQGVRFSVDPQESVKASADGKVLFSGNELGGQNIVVIQHPKGFLTAYGPMKKITVRKGQSVSRGKSLGLPSGKNLYFEMRRDRKPINPMQHLN